MTESSSSLNLAVSTSSDIGQLRKEDKEEGMGEEEVRWNESISFSFDIFLSRPLCSL